MSYSLVAAYNMLQRRNYRVRVPYGEILINGIAFALIMFGMKNCP